MWVMKIEKNLLLMHCFVDFSTSQIESMFVEMHSNINTPKSDDLFHLTNQQNFLKDRSNV